jgi:hypothetical protein
MDEIKRIGINHIFPAIVPKFIQDIKDASHPYDPEKLYNSCECVPLKEYASDYDRGFHQAMTLVRGWIRQGKSP